MTEKLYYTTPKTYEWQTEIVRFTVNETESFFQALKEQIIHASKNFPLS
jgi:4-hydroxy-3-methylbut-2-en-1-yl diphosphate synthase IspG/GcpE